MPQNPIITYPTPAYQNPPIEPRYYKPRVFIISAIAMGVTTLVTTSLDNDYVIGQNIRFLIPNRYGSRALNEVSGIVISKPMDNQVEVDINSNSVDPFIPSPTFLTFESKTLPQIVAVGDVNTGAINNHGRSCTHRHIPGSFIDISPN